MADKQQQSVAVEGGSGGGGGGGPQPTMTEYKKSQARVRELVEKRRLLERRLNQVEEGIAQKESAYLENTLSGNIITGFDNYMKGIGGAAAQRRKTGPMEQNRVFSRSSISYRPNVSESTTPGSTPGSHAQTPVSASFSGSTPTAAAGGGGTKNAKKKKQPLQQQQQLQQQETEDSENDAQTGKKRTAFGARK
ncbi:Histone H4 acetyltransferase, NuA4 complex, Eaf6 [Cordyceps fumosorosea ARSEF 2679]|uniref:Chromatin modification-related protein EAF6 n=1 Tax=Cordyceps fumosorosea (strain ARSEF 2679) TaxID=1081104 RepID=A0A168DZR9_CORFA|nr:Histone H4 acetyltransferase, NuA4 complex, Eaf6 [Cordyceps fumosorosea ARSEF 2679]OAA73198.1 Histone H4 acetyltransferase, NuA4 complex, Eaf6 [Cordyceps fumosorosea ARSEF 2679]